MLSSPPPRIVSYTIRRTDGDQSSRSPDPPGTKGGMACISFPLTFFFFISGRELGSQYGPTSWHPIPEYHRAKLATGGCHWSLYLFRPSESRALCMSHTMWPSTSSSGVSQAHSRYHWQHHPIVPPLARGGKDDHVVHQLWKDGAGQTLTQVSQPKSNARWMSERARLAGLSRFKPGGLRLPNARGTATANIPLAFKHKCKCSVCVIAAGHIGNKQNGDSTLLPVGSALVKQSTIWAIIATSILRSERTRLLVVMTNTWLFAYEAFSNGRRGKLKNMMTLKGPT
ncbi:hypothetical protein QBC34DRAFT_14350 [Podospora aff. communis PSN243]|uniref:Uncharacterized protein n=1 Tax=Podospora aff. communis PSN243 TaxID=3040156 RepID=A0AAV9H8P7_9PEZI|nr:hypothetical protein QBC34DRAFT_14350 [Podospora aff. communis PSN243]